MKLIELISCPYSSSATRLHEISASRSTSVRRSSAEPPFLAERPHSTADYLNGEPVPLDDMNNTTFGRVAWFKKHGPKETRPPLDTVLAHLRSEGVTRIAAAGYCFG